MSEQILTMTFGQGLDEGRQPELVDGSTAALAALNVEQVRVGAASKSLGYDDLATTRTTGTRTAGKRMIAHGNLPGVIDGSVLDLWIDGAAVSQSVDNVPPFTMTLKPVFAVKGGFDPKRTAATRTYACAWYDFVVVGDVGVCVYSWDNGGTKTLEYAIWSVSTGVVVLGGTLSTLSVYGAAQGHAAQLVACGTRVALFLENGTANTILATTMDATSLTTSSSGWGAPGAIFADWDQTDFAVCSDGSKIYIAYSQTGGTFINVARITALLVVEQQSAAAIPVIVAPIAFAVDVANGNLWVLVSFAAGVSAFVAIVDPTNVAGALAPLQVTCGGAAAAGVVTHLGIRAVSSTKAWTCGSARNAGAVGEGWCGRHMTYSAGWTSGIITRWPSLATLTAPFVVGAATYAWTLQSGTADGAAQTWGEPRVVGCVALDEVLPGAAAAATLAPVVALPAPRRMVYATAYLGVGAAPGSLPYHPCQRAHVSGDTVSVLLPQVTNALSFAFVWVTLTLSDARAWDSEHMGGTTVLAGAVVTETDGARLTETAFCHRPVVAGTITGVGLTGTFSYVAIWEDVDSAGNVSWSAPSDPFTTPALINQSLTMRVSTLAMTRRRNARAVLYRTENGGSTYYRVTALANVASTTTLTFVDALDDTDLRLNHRLYGMGALPTTAGASQPRQAPSGQRTFVRHGDRLVGIADDQATLWYGAPLVSGEARWFSDVFTIPLDSRRPLVAVASQDGTILAWTETEVWAIRGDGPPENGGNGTEFSPPQRLTSDSGCIEPRSLVTVSDGTFFQSSRGLDIVTRALSVEWAGLAVQTTLEAYPTIVAAAHDQERNIVMWDCVSDAGNGITLALDLNTKSWSTERRNEAADLGAPSVDAEMVRLAGKERHHWLKSNGVVHRRKLASSSTAYLDLAATWRTMRAGTGWYRVAGMAGYAQIKRLDMMFKRVTDTDISISYYYDDAAAPESTTTRTAAELLAAGGRLDILPTRQKCRTFRVEISDAAPTVGTLGSGAGLILYGLALVYDPIGGVDRRPNASR